MRTPRRLGEGGEPHAGVLTPHRRTQPPGSDTIRGMAAPAVDIRPLDLATWPALAALFEQGGDPKTCWCMYWRLPSGEWSPTTAESNRAGLRRACEVDELPPGLVAFGDGTAVGWVAVAPRAEYQRLARSRTIPRLPGEPQGAEVWSVPCFVVARSARRTGLAGALLSAAVRHAAAHGAGVVEGYPVRTGGARIPAAAAYTGTLPMFERAGFTVVAPTTSRAAGAMRVVVRRDAASPLTPRG